MTAAADLRVPFEAAAAAFGVDATVDPDGTPIPTTAIWVTATTDDVPVGEDEQVREPRRVLSCSRDEVPRLPVGTIIEAPLRRGEDVRRWRVDSLEDLDPDQVSVRVVPAPEAT